MSDTYTRQCDCGAMAWTIGTPARGTRVTCFCRDCQTYARHLDPETPVLDELGGTHLLQILPDAVTFTRGAEHLSVLRLGPRGPFRWYAGCCRTPVANTLSTGAVPFAGMVLPPGETAFGRPVAQSFTDGARGSVKGYGMARAGLAVIRRAISGRIAGAHRRSPFFAPDGTTAASPHVLTLDQRRAAAPR